MKLGRILIVFLLMSQVSALGQQQLSGNYAGLAALGTDPANAVMQVTSQDNRIFLGRLKYIEQDSILLDSGISGTIAASGRCSISTDTQTTSTSLKLSWQSSGEGAAVLTGTTTVALRTGKIGGSVVLVREFSQPGIDWSSSLGAHAGQLKSSVKGVSRSVNVSISRGARGLLTLTFNNWIQSDSAAAFAGVSSETQRLVAAGVLPTTGETITINADVTLDRFGQPLMVTGEFVTQSSNGLITDSGIIAILIG